MQLILGVTDKIKYIHCDYIDSHGIVKQCRGQSRILEMAFICIKVYVVRFADFI